MLLIVHQILPMSKYKKITCVLTRPVVESAMIILHYHTKNYVNTKNVVDCLKNANRQGVDYHFILLLIQRYKIR